MGLSVGSVPAAQARVAATSGLVRTWKSIMDSVSQPAKCSVSGGAGAGKAPTGAVRKIAKFPKDETARLSIVIRRANILLD